MHKEVASQLESIWSDQFWFFVLETEVGRLWDVFRPDMSLEMSQAAIAYAPVREPAGNADGYMR